MKVTKTITIDAQSARNIENYLSNEVHQDENDTVQVIARFDEHAVMCIKCCGSEDEDEPAWTEAVLFYDGYEVNCTEPADDFLGEWPLEYKGVEYVCIVEVEKPQANKEA